MSGRYVCPALQITKMHQKRACKSSLIAPFQTFSTSAQTSTKFGKFERETERDRESHGCQNSTSKYLLGPFRGHWKDLKY